MYELVRELRVLSSATAADDDVSLVKCSNEKQMKLVIELETNSSRKSIPIHLASTEDEIM